MPKTRMMLGKKRKLIFFEERFLTSTDWTAPQGCTEVDVFLVGGGAGGAYGGGGGGYTKTFKKNTTGWRDGGAIKVTSGQTISIIVGVGGSPGGMSGPGADGQYSQFMNSTYRAEGGVAPKSNYPIEGTNGGSGGAGYVNGIGGSDGSNGGNGSLSSGGKGQGHTTREFGEPTGKLYSSGGSTNNGGTVGTNGADNTGNGGGGQGHAGGKGGSGIVIIRGYKYA